MTNCRHCAHVIEFDAGAWVHSDSLKRVCWTGKTTAQP